MLLLFLSERNVAALSSGSLPSLPRVESRKLREECERWSSWRERAQYRPAFAEKGGSGLKDGKAGLS